MHERLHLSQERLPALVGLQARALLLPLGVGVVAPKGRVGRERADISREGAYETEGIPLQEEILGGLVGAFTTDVGALSTYTSLWRYDSYAEREEKRARLQADERWQAFLRKVQPLMHTQQNRILVPTPFSPLR